MLASVLVAVFARVGFLETRLSKEGGRFGVLGIGATGSDVLA
jgi:hypothetical protein